MKNMAVFAILRDRPHAEAGVKALVDSGFREEDVSVGRGKSIVRRNVGVRVP